MAKAVYINIHESTEDVGKLQTNIMIFVNNWVKTNKTPVPKIEIIRKMEKSGSKDFKTEHALILLLRRGYIRRAQKMSNKTYYVLLRSV